MKFAERLHKADFLFMIQRMISLLIFANDITAVMCPAVCFSHLIPVCPITADVVFTHWVQGLSARFLHYEVIIFPLIINKGLGGIC